MRTRGRLQWHIDAYSCPMKDEEYPIHIDNIVKMTDKYAKMHPEITSKKGTKKLAHLLLVYGIVAKPTLLLQAGLQAAYGLE